MPDTPHTSQPELDPPQDTDEQPGAPRWVKVLGLVFVVLVLLALVLHLTGNSLGGPGSHLGEAAPGWP